jgi:hypothetical protein
VFIFIAPHAIVVTMITAALDQAGWRDGYRFAKSQGKPTVSISRKRLCRSDFCDPMRSGAAPRSESVHRNA